MTNTTNTNTGTWSIKADIIGGTEIVATGLSEDRAYDLARKILGEFTRTETVFTQDDVSGDWLIVGNGRKAGW